jgi:hypothetical protein
VFCISWNRSIYFLPQLFTHADEQKESAELCIEVLQAFAATLDHLAQSGNGQDNKIG